MYKSFLVSEWKKWLRDPLLKFMVFYPILFGVVGRYVLPLIAENTGFSIGYYADLIIVILVLLVPHVYGALVGFSILDDRDDHILTSIHVTPLGIHQFLSFRMAVVLVLSFIATTYVIWFSNIGDLSLGNILAIAFLVSLAAPMTGLFINALAKNKIEGFAVMKGAGMIIIFPIVSLFFLDSKELFFSFAPGFWPAKAISSLIRGDVLLLTFNQYIVIGLVYVLFLNAIVYKIFIMRIKV
ncbi:MAG: ABC transporter permease [Anaerobacillus sp.]|uniref:ABC transporter permease n=1 Tax=Anaerobacillus sp. TaxID=1872506 RepID=UPI0039189E82